MKIRRQLHDQVLAAAREYPVVTILGPRQSGKTTLARMAFPDHAHVSLEDPDTRYAAQADPRGFLEDLAAGAILDEVQRVPSLLSYLQGIVDADPAPGRFVLTGSHQPRLHEAIAQSLAGRTAVLTLWPFSLPELRHYAARWDPFDLVVRSTFPPVHDRGLDPARFLAGYVETVLERDVRPLLRVRDPVQFEQFLVLLAGRVGQLLNYSSLSGDVGVSVPTIRSWVCVLVAAHQVFLLPPWSANVRKRVVKAPKLYFVEPAVAAFLLGIENRDQAARHPLRGALYENLVVAELLKGMLHRGRPAAAWFVRDSRGLEVDLLLRVRGRLLPLEIKSARTFSPSFLRPFERLPRFGIPDLAPGGALLYDGDREYRIHGVRVFNPLATPDPWDAVVSLLDDAPEDGKTDRGAPS